MEVLAGRVLVLLTVLLCGQIGSCLNVHAKSLRPYSTLVLGRTSYGRSSSSSYPYSSTLGRHEGAMRVATRGGARHLEVEGVEVPVYKFRGEDARLECQYDRGSDPLYSVKWYKDDQEFYRYLSQRKNPKQTFNTPGVHVDLQRSNAKKVQLRNLTFNSTGMYKCEVSGDSPYFRTYENQKRMTVVELPERGPTITGGQSHYKVGDTARLNCTASKSKPAALLTWYINDEKVMAPHLIEYYPWVHRDGLESKRLGLSFTVNQSHFLAGRVELRCKAMVATFYSATREEDATVSGEAPVVLQTKEEFVHAWSSGSTVLPTPTLTTITTVLVVLATLVADLDVT